MRHLRKPLRLGQVALTAIMVLIAGLPYSRCVCAESRSSLSTPGFRACCCATACLPVQPATDNTSPKRERGNQAPSLTLRASVAADHKGKCPCCCGHKTQAPPESGAAGHRLQPAGCIRVLTQSDLVAVAIGNTKVSQDVTPLFLVTPAACHTVVPAIWNCSPTHWQDYSIPPPTDLVITLQHFVI